MKDIVTTRSSLSPEERNLLSVAYKNVVGSRRSAWRVICSIESKRSEDQDSQMKDLAKSYKEKIEAELKEICNEVLVRMSLKLECVYFVASCIVGRPF